MGFTEYDSNGCVEVCVHICMVGGSNMYVCGYCEKSLLVENRGSKVFFLSLSQRGKVQPAGQLCDETDVTGSTLAINPFSNPREFC